MDGAVLLDAALEVVGDRGLAALTHESVDVAAGAVPGATAAAYPTRRDLVGAVADRCIERELEMAAGERPAVEATPDGLAEAFGGFVARALGQDRTITLARHELQMEVARTPALRPAYAVGADAVDTWAIDLLRRAGSPTPERDLGIIANYATGLVFHELALPTPDLDATTRVRDLIDALGWPAP